MGGVFAKNTSLETKFPSPFGSGNFSSLDWYFSQIPLPNMIYLYNIYLSFIRPVLEYADIVWDNCTLHESNLLESVQVEAGRIITGLRVNSSKTKLYEELGWELLYKRREKHKFILMYKIINGHTPNYLSDLVQPYTENVHNYNLRQQISNENLRLPYCNAVSYNKSFFT